MDPEPPTVAAVTLRCRGHPNIRATHPKTIELTSDDDLSASGTCIVGVSCHYDEEALLALRGSVRVTLSCGGFSDTLTARVNPLYRGDDPIILRRSAEAGPRALCIGASKGAARLDRDLVAALARADAELVVTLERQGAQDPVPGVLFLVGMPLGNESDVSGRALDVLASVDRVAAEDTRTTRQFLDRHGIRRPTLSFHDHNERGRTPQVVERLLAGERIALVSEAGMPLVSDPGFHLVRAAHEAGLTVTVVPGPDAVTASLAVAGIAPNDFRFLGFVPRKSGARRRLFADLKAAPYTSVFYEAPHRILETLDDIGREFGPRPMALCKNLTKFGEEVLRGDALAVRGQIEAAGAPRGELVIVIEGAPASPASAAAAEGDLGAMAAALVRDGVPTKTIAAAYAKAAGIGRREAYEHVVRLK